MPRIRSERPFLYAAAVLAPLWALAAPAWAHHGWGGYDSSRLVVLEGTLEEVAFQNPHASARMPAEGQTWLLVLAPPSRMTTRGLPDGALAPGKVVRAEGYVSRSDPAELRAERIIVDGRTVELR
ncbi:DUF6152 family protein [Arenibaculum pallidiluteum]|uniref:DUF6152 family protein n=1 Tax=Arenibaculum pallidiluteum TaxID=2812559 RepID=UPI001F2CF440|nr:DUF6152 family protein [Arenibaculum pallidiluteum]